MGTRIAAVLVAGLCLCLPGIGRADGVILIRETTEVAGAKPSQTAQQAAIVWADGRETLHLLSNYSGPPQDFAWVIPVPGEPEVAKSSWQVFARAEEATRPRLTVETERVVSGGPLACSAAMETQDAGLPAGVTVIKSLDIEELHADVIAAKEGGGLLAWLRGNGYQVPDTARDVLQGYIDKSFFFVAVKIRKAEVEAAEKAGEGQVITGLTPLAITFDSEEAFFPLKISSISSAPENEILILTVTPARMTTADYKLVELTKEDIVGSLDLAAGNPEAFNPGPAVKAAQARADSPSLVVVAALQAEKWKDVEWNGVNPSGEKWGDKPVWITRFQTVLKPDAMRDITFSTGENKALDPHFTVTASLSGWQPVASAGFGVIALGLVTCSVGLPVGPRRGRRLRSTALLLLAAAVCLC